jgi:capsule polysaccharide export protein KpsE/RkpR
MGSSDGIKEVLEKLTATPDKIQATQESMQASLDKLAPLAPLADQLAAIPAKVTSLQSSAYENAEQIRALNLAVIRAEKSLRGENGAVGGDADAFVHSIVKPLKHPGAPPDRLR